MIVASPPSSGTITTGFEKEWLAGCEATKKAATQPTAASPIASGSRGASGLAGGASSTVNMASTSAAPEMAAMIQKSGRQAFDCACTPPTNGPNATAPNMHMFMITAVSRSLFGG